MSEVRDNLDAQNLVTVFRKLIEDGARNLRPASRRLVFCELHEFLTGKIAEFGPKRGSQMTVYTNCGELP